jgi:hypothetical protein
MINNYVRQAISRTMQYSIFLYHVNVKNEK